MVCAAAAVVLFAVLIALSLEVSAGGNAGPRVGDHWHAPFAIFIGDELQPPIQEVITPEGVHTHGDGVIHLHPHIPIAEGSGAGLAHFFGDMGGKLSNTEMRIPGREETYKNGDEINGQRAELRILKGDSGIHPLGQGFAEARAVCDGKPEREFERVGAAYLPQDGDCIRIVFGPAPGE